MPSKSSVGVTKYNCAPCLDLQEKYTLSQGVVKIGEEEITELHKSGKDNGNNCWKFNTFIENV